MSKARDLADLIAAGSVLADGTVEVADISDLTATAAELNTLDGITATTTELNYTDGVTSNIQTQIDTKAPTASPTFTGTVTGPTINASTALQIGGVEVTATAAELNIMDGVTATAAELNYVDGVTSNIQTQIDALQTSFTTNVITSNTTASANNHYYINGSAITLTLPLSPSVGDEVRVSVVTADKDNIIGRNGSNIMSAAEDLTLNSAYAVIYFRYVDATIGWAFS